MVSALLPQRSQGSPLKNHMLFISNGTVVTVTSQTNPVSPVDMASTSQTAISNWQAMTAQPKLQKWLHVPPRNRKLTISPTGYRKEEEEEEDFYAVLHAATQYHNSINNLPDDERLIQCASVKGLHDQAHCF